MRLRLVVFVVLFCAGCRSASFGSTVPDPTTRSFSAAQNSRATLEQPISSPTLAYPRVSAFVTYVIDGDTIVVLQDGSEYHLRYIGMDTPEVHMPYYAEATEANRKLLYHKSVFLEVDVSETDKYGRLLRYVYLADGTMVNEWLVCNGYAEIFTFPPNVRYVDKFLKCQRSAVASGLGLWGLHP